MDIYRHYEDTPEGNTVSFFYNRGTGLVVVDVIHNNETGGNEIVRMFADATAVVDLSHCEAEECTMLTLK